MSRFETRGRHFIVLAGFMALVGVMTAAAGCEPIASDRLVVATSWPIADRRRLESEFQNWVKSSSGLNGPKAIDVNWLILEPGDDLVRIVHRRHPPDVLLGGGAPALSSLAQHHDLSPIRSADSAPWAIVRHDDERVTDKPSPDQVDPIATQPGQATITINDPRSDPISLAWAVSQLGHGRFADGYSRLVRAANNPRRIGRHASLTQGWTEGVAIPRSARHQDFAQVFLQYLAETHRLTAHPNQPRNETDTELEILVADLLGATLVDAQDELWAAWAALERAGYPATALKWMTEAPPWPPASVAKMLDQPGEDAMTLTETLAREIAPEPAVRAWLVRSWLSPPRLVDETLLIELTRAVEGRLCHEPRFHAWLRAEWTAWARQRYRRVLRITGS